MFFRAMIDFFLKHKMYRLKIDSPMDGIFFCTDELDEVFAAGNTIELSLSIPKKYLTLYDDCDEIVKRIHCTDIIIELHFGG